MSATSLHDTLAATGTLMVEPRIMRRVIRRHRQLSGMGLEVLHGHCYTLPRTELLDIASADDLGTKVENLRERPVLLPRPDVAPPGGHEGPAALRNYWRLTFHALVHQAYEARSPGAAMLRERIHRLGQAEFDEIRFVLRQDDLLLPPRGDGETWVEFAAVYLELRHFAPAQLHRTFPTLHDLDAIDAVLARDLDAQVLLERSRPAGAPELPSVEEAGEGNPAPGALVPVPAASPVLVARGVPARARGNLVRSAVLAQRGGDAAGARADVAALVARVRAAIPGERAGAAAWIDALYPVVAWIAGQRTLRRTVEIRLLFDLQKAALAHERAISAVDPVGWALSLGRRKIVHPLPAGQEVRVARQLEHARGKLGGVRLPDAERRRLGEIVRGAAEDADARVRSVLRPRLEQILDEVDLAPANVPERVARHKLVDELLDQVVAHGFLTMGQVRDAISRNQLKLPDLGGPGELWHGDALLQADRRFSRALEGVYRPAEIYLRALQKLSSIFFATRLGRFLTLYFILPILGAYIPLEGVAHIVGPLVHWATGKHIEIFSWPRFAALTLFVFALIHLPHVRRAVGGGFVVVGRILRFVFVVAPRAVWRLGVVQLVVRSRPAALLGHYVLQPALVAVIFWAVAERFDLPRREAWAVAGGFFVVANLVLNSRTGRTAKEIVGDVLVRSGRQIGLNIVPGIFHLLVEFFKALIDAIERGIYLVDELLRYRQGDGTLSLWLKGTIGIVWGIVTYILRIYLNLFIEPTVNPLKHFPVVTVAAKIQLPLTPTLMAGMRTTVVPILGHVVGNAISGFTILLLPGVCGFLAWEMKENWKLYRANRPPELGAVPIGHHGETLGAYLKPGFHSGTVPKTYARLRRAAWKGLPSANKHREALHHIAETLRIFAERELVELLADASAWTAGPITVGDVEVASNRVRIELVLGGRSALLGFEEQSGMILAGVVRAGWIADLAPEPRLALEAALAGFYKRAGVDMVREQIVADLTHDSPYDVADEGLVVWPDGQYLTEVVYALDPEADVFDPVVRGPAPPVRPASANAHQLMFSRQPLPWTTWVGAWSQATPPRVVDGPDLLGPS